MCDCCKDEVKSMNDNLNEETPKTDMDNYNVYGSKLEDVEKIKYLEHTIEILKTIIADKELEIYKLKERLDDYKSLNRC